MTKYMVEAKVVGQYMLNAATKQIDLIAPEIAREALPGQFVNVQVTKHTAPLLRRPLGVAAVNPEEGTISLMYRIIGEATRMLAEVCSGDTLNLLGPLGHGFALSAKRPLLIGGGLGLAPLFYLATAFKQRAKGEALPFALQQALEEADAGKLSDGANNALPQEAAVLMGGRTAEDLFWQDMYRDVCPQQYLTTDNGSLGIRGTVLAKLPDLLAAGRYDCAYVCGPVPMMKAVAAACQAANLPCQVSLERYMACGLGACLSCSCGGVGKRLKVCTDGPVFWAQEVAEW
jgi:dihydroorotate dehydrogenase electron transfer subunit